MSTTNYKLATLLNEFPAELDLGDNEVQIWKLDLSKKYSWDQYLDLLTTSEHLKAKAFKFSINKRQFLAGKIFSKIILSSLLNVSSQEINFDYTPLNKPCLGSHDIHFNISHSGDYVIIGITKLSPIGVDVERISNNIEINKLGQRFFSKNEASIISKYKGALSYEAFFKCWTKKEAFIKAHGDGLNIPLGSFEVNIYAKKALLSKLEMKGEIASDWTIEEINMKPSYQAALCIKAKNYKLDIYKLT